MRTLYELMLWYYSFSLAIAEAAPVRNPARIEALRADVRRWKDALDYVDLPPLFGS